MKTKATQHDIRREIFKKEQTNFVQWQREYSEQKVLNNIGCPITNELRDVVSGWFRINNYPIVDDLFIFSKPQDLVDQINKYLFERNVYTDELENYLKA